uniref:Uncharacterized protein n=1 Tax=Romanomermis culicivorax TaxID=13658 RepID=A0A915KGT2_ROMCU
MAKFIQSPQENTIRFLNRFEQARQMPISLLSVKWRCGKNDGIWLSSSNFMDEYYSAISLQPSALKEMIEGAGNAATPKTAKNNNNIDNMVAAKELLTGEYRNAQINAPINRRLILAEDQIDPFIVNQMKEEHLQRP